MRKKTIKVIINSSYAVDQTAAHVSQPYDNDNIIMELEPGTTVEGILLKMPSVGSPDRWDDIMLHVFVNQEIAGFDRVLKDNDVINLPIPVSEG